MAHYKSNAHPPNTVSSPPADTSAYTHDISRSTHADDSVPWPGNAAIAVGKGLVCVGGVVRGALGGCGGLLVRGGWRGRTRARGRMLGAGVGGAWLVCMVWCL